MEKLKPYPEIVYKYRGWRDKNHRNVLMKNELYLSSPRDFNDPFDCRIPENFYLLDNAEKKAEYINGFMERNTKAMLEVGDNPKKQIEFLNYKLTEDIDEFQQRNEAMLYAGQDNHLGVLSLSARWNSILMWSHYGDFHRGYCVGFYEEKLRESALFGRGGNVITPVDENFPKLDPRDQNHMERAILQTHYKSKDWAYENEYRLTQLFYPDKPTEEARKRIIGDDYFAEIIIGLQTSASDQEEILKIANEKKISVFKAIKIPFKFLIDKVQIG